MLMQSTVSFAFSREKQMLKRTPFLVLSVLLFCSVSVCAQGLTTANTSLLAPINTTSSSPEAVQLFSTPVSRKFFEIAYELANSEDAAGPKVEQALVFLAAAMKLDSDVKGIRPLMIEFACRDQEWDYTNLVYGLLVDYVDEFADLEVAKKAVSYLLGRANSREQREKFLEQMLETLGSKNTILASELGTMLGLLKAEKADYDAAEFYLMQAYKNNRYNWLAFARLVEIKPERIGPEIYLERLRLALRENPSDIEAAIVFAEQTERFQLYETSTAIYEYCADLFSYLYPSGTLPARIYLPWAISSYNSRRNQSKCLEIAKRVRREGGFDLRLEAIAGKAAIKMGDTELATLIFQAIEEKTRRLIMLQDSNQSSMGSGIQDDTNSQQSYTQQFAWYYCFVLPIPGEAVKWANIAYKADNSPVTASVLAYALVMNKDIEWAKPLINNFELTQISELAQAQIQLAEGQNDLAIQTLTSAIARDPGSFAAERAKDIMVQQGKEYFPAVEADTVLNGLTNVFGQSLVPVFTPPEQIISAQFQIRGGTFIYGSEFSGFVAITNNSSEPLVMSDHGLFKGNIRIDANISGDLSKNIPNLVFTRVRTAFLIEPGRSILIPLRLMTGELRKTLLTYPQASLDIEFTLYLDPVITNEGKVANRLVYLEPKRVRISRPGIELSGKYLRDRFNSLSNDQIDQKINTARLFTGLLKEQYAMSNRTPPYKFMYAEWIAPLLRDALSHNSGLLRNPADDEWIVKVHTMADMLSLPLDHELISVVAESLNDNKWPVRMMAIYLLSTITDNQFNNVLEWVAKNDPSKNVRDMATVLDRVQPGRQGQL